jgi:hypothetical protein
LNLKQWCELDERIYIGETDEQYKQYAGFDYSEKLIEQLAEIKLYNSKIFIDFFSDPRALLLGAIEDTAYSKNKKLELDLQNIRNTKIGPPKNLSIDEASNVYSALIKEYVGFEIPGEYWLLHHILPEAIMYVPSYLLAAVRAAELETYMQNRFGDNWWTERESGKILSDIMRPGANIDLSIFSKLDSTTYMKEITEPV